MGVLQEPDLVARTGRDRPVDETAFDQLFRAYFDPLRWFVYRYLRSWEEAEDVVHDLFSRLWERRGELESVGDVPTYLYTAARNRALMHLRHRGVEQRWRAGQQHEGPSPMSVDAPAAPMDPEQKLLSAEVRAGLQQAVDGLAPRQKEVVLRRWRGESYETIASALNISVSTVSVHMTRALAHLRGALSRFL